MQEELDYTTAAILAILLSAVCCVLFALVASDAGLTGLLWAVMR